MTLYLSDFKLFSQATVNDKSLKNPDREKFETLFFTQFNNHFINKHNITQQKNYFRTLKNPDWDSLIRLTKAVLYRTVTQTKSFVPNKPGVLSGIALL